MTWLGNWWGLLYLAVGFISYVVAVWVYAGRIRDKRASDENVDTEDITATLGIGLVVVLLGWPCVVIVFGAHKLFKRWSAPIPLPPETEEPPVSDSKTYRAAAGKP